MSLRACRRRPDASAGEEALDAEDVFEDRSEASSDVTSNSSERDGEALSVAVHEGRLDDAPGEEGVREGMSGAGIEVRSVGPDEGDGPGSARGRGCPRRCVDR